MIPIHRISSSSSSLTSSLSSLSINSSFSSSCLSNLPYRSYNSASSSSSSFLTFSPFSFSSSSPSSSFIPHSPFPLSSSSFLSPSFPFSIPHRFLHERKPEPDPPQRSHEYFQFLSKKMKLEAKKKLFSVPYPPIEFSHQSLVTPQWEEMNQLNDAVAMTETINYIKNNDNNNWKFGIPPTQFLNNNDDNNASSLASSSDSPDSISPSLSPSPSSLPPKPTHFAIFESRGFQYKVVEKDLLMVPYYESLTPGDTIIFNNVLCLASSQYSVVGRPRILHAKVEGVVEEHTRTKKVIVFHKKRRKNHRKTKGHRSDVTLIRIKTIEIPENYQGKMFGKNEISSVKVAGGAGNGQVVKV